MKKELRIELVDQIRSNLKDAKDSGFDLDEDAMVEAYMRKYKISLRDVKECLKMAKGNAPRGPQKSLRMAENANLGGSK